MGDEIEKLLEQMPRVECREIILRLHKEHFEFSLSEMGDACVEAQQEADAEFFAKWIAEQDLLRAPTRVELKAKLMALFGSALTEQFIDDHVDELLRRLRERG